MPHLISLTWSAFRTHFAQRGNALGLSVSFVPGTPNQITRLAGSFITDGFLDTHLLDVRGSASNDTARGLTVSGVAALALDIEETPVAEGPVTVDLHSGWYDVDGAPEWPGHMAGEAGRTKLVRSGGFTGGITGMPSPYSTGTITLTVAGYTDDAAYDVPEYRWYVSQGSDDPARQYWAVAGKAATPTDTFSGAIQLSLTALAIAEFGSTVAMDDLAALLGFAHVYVRRQSDGAIQWLDLHRETMGG